MIKTVLERRTQQRVHHLARLQASLALVISSSWKDCCIWRQALTTTSTWTLSQFHSKRKESETTQSQSSWCLTLTKLLKSETATWTLISTGLKSSTC